MREAIKKGFAMAENLQRGVERVASVFGGLGGKERRKTKRN